MRIGLTAKLLMVLGLTSAVSVLAMALAARWSFQHGFLDYLGQQELKRIEPLSDALVQAHRERGSWDFLARDPGAWPRFVGQAMAPALRGSSEHPWSPQDARKSVEAQQPALPVPPHPGPPEMPPPGPYGAPPFGPLGGPPHGPPQGPTHGHRRLPPHPASLQMRPPGPHEAPLFGPPGVPPRSPRRMPPHSASLQMQQPGLHEAPALGSPHVPPHDFGRMPPHSAASEMGQPGPHEAPAFALPGSPPPRPGFRPPPPRAGHLIARLRLLDDEHRQVAGVTRETEDEMLRPLVSGGVVVGWLGLSPPPWLEDELAQRFNSQHNRSLLWISLAALILAVLLGLTFGEAILRRIRAVAAGARQLAKGNYGTRITRKGRDELTGLAEDFNHLAVALERSEQLRRSGMADVSHELRTPLAVARAELDALIDGIRPCTRERLEQLHGRLLTLGRLLDDLYDLALSDTGALDYRYEALDLAELVRTAVGEMHGSFLKKGLEMRVEVEDELPMDGDRGRLRQVMDNLLANSLRYTDPGGFIQIVAERRGDEILISMADTPPGVELASLERLFDRFYRVEASRSRAKGGAGLGLAICRNIVEAHRGSIAARPAESGGLAIEIRLPASKQ